MGLPSPRGPGDDHGDDPGSRIITAREPSSDAQFGLQFSLYPLRQEHLRPAVGAAVKAAAAEGVEVTVGRLSTFAPGDEDSVFAAVRAAFDAAKSFGPTVMVVTLSSGLPSEETVAQIQGASER